MEYYTAIGIDVSDKTSKKTYGGNRETGKLRMESGLGRTDLGDPRVTADKLSGR